MTEVDFKIRKDQLERYMDVTKSQLFFARGILFVEGISEKLLVNSFAAYISKNLDDHRCEMVSVDGISFYAFIHLFNSTDKNKRLRQPVAILTDDDRYAKAKNTFKNLTARKFANLDQFYKGLYSSAVNNRLGNLASTLRHKSNSVSLFSAFKTLEFEIALANVDKVKADFEKNFLIDYLKTHEPASFAVIDIFIQTITTVTFSKEEREKIAVLVWKAMPSKAQFAQHFSFLLDTALREGKSIIFNVPEYIREAIKHVTR